MDELSSIKIVLEWSENDNGYFVRSAQNTDIAAGPFGSMSEALKEFGLVYEEVAKEEPKRYDPRPAPGWWERVRAMKWPWGLAGDA